MHPPAPPPPPPPAASVPPPSPDLPPPPTQTSTEFWTETNVTRHVSFKSVEESLEQFHWRSSQYFDYLDLMPVAGRDGLAVLDYGCGPGNDIIGFGHFSKPSRLVGADVSVTSLAEASDRLKLHGIDAELVRLAQQSPVLPFDDGTFDVIHSSGVLHHVEDPVAVLKELRRVLKPTGEFRLMVYNYQSIFVHLYVPYVVQIEEQRFSKASLADAFRELTDGPGCPISRPYKVEEIQALAAEAGFAAEHTGNSVSAYEISLLGKRGLAIAHAGLAREHRDFLLGLRFDDRGLPRFEGQYAGVDGCYRLTPSR